MFAGGIRRGVCAPANGGKVFVRARTVGGFPTLCTEQVFQTFLSFGGTQAFTSPQSQLGS